MSNFTRIRRSISSTPSENEDSRSNDKSEKDYLEDSLTSEESSHSRGQPDAMYRQLKKLCMDNPGKFLENWNPESSNRETRKLTRKIYSEGVRKHIVYDDHGVLIKSGKDLCDCLEADCPGCHFPCSKCNSCKCGHECRNNRRWTYDQVEIEGSDFVLKNKFK